MNRERISESVRRLVAERSGGCCEYCRSQARFAMQAFSVEHIQPKLGGGDDSPENLAFSCQGCNNHKYTKTEAADPLTGDLVPLFHPRKQVWADHFFWNADQTQIEGVTPTGRATIVALRLNREGVRNLRRILSAAGEHPPGEPKGSST